MSKSHKEKPDNILTGQSISLRRPIALDGFAVHQLIQRCPPLDSNSAYCNLLQCSHFHNTSLLAEDELGLVGFISGYRLPEDDRCLFIWQVAIAERGRGQGLASKMLQRLVSNTKSQYLHTTITESNLASWATFTRLAKALNAPLKSRPFFTKDDHFQGQHDAELLVIIGPVSISQQEYLA